MQLERSLLSRPFRFDKKLLFSCVAAVLRGLLFGKQHQNYPERLRFRCWFGFRRTEPSDVHSKGEQPVPKQNGKKPSPVSDDPNQARLDGRVPPGKVVSAREGRKEVPNTKG